MASASCLLKASAKFRIQVVCSAKASPFGASLGEEALRQRLVLVVGFHRLEQCVEQAFVILCADGLGRGHRDPVGSNARIAQHRLDTPAARMGDDEHGGALLPRAARAARTVLQAIGVAR